MLFLELGLLRFTDNSESARVCDGFWKLNTYAFRSLYGVGQGFGCTRYWVWGASLCTTARARGSLPVTLVTWAGGDQAFSCTCVTSLARAVGAWTNGEPIVRIGVTWVLCPMTGACQPSSNPWSVAWRISEGHCAVSHCIQV